MSEKLHAKVIHPPNNLTKRRLPPSPEPAATVKREIIQNRVNLWRNTLYAGQVQARVAQAIGSDERQQEAELIIEQAIKALDELAAILVELQQ